MPRKSLENIFRPIKLTKNVQDFRKNNFRVVILLRIKNKQGKKKVLCTDLLIGLKFLLTDK